MKIYKKANPNKRKLPFLFVLQVLLGVLPVFLFLIFVLEYGREYYVLACIFISIMLFALAGYIIIGQRYNVLLSGVRGERSLLRVAKRLDSDFVVFANLPVRYKKNRSELDLLLVGTRGIVIVEVKNHSGVICGSDSDDMWLQRKYYKNGKDTETQMENPFHQIRRQREILKSILRSHEMDVWIDNVLYFSNPNVKLNLDIHGSNYVCGSEKELTEFIASYSCKKPLDEAQSEKIVEILRELNN